MAQLLESTRKYLQTSTKLGRRLSQYKDHSDSEQDQKQHRGMSTDGNSSDHSIEYVVAHSPSTSPSSNKVQNRLSGLFSFERRNSKQEDRQSSSPSPSPHSQQQQLLQQQQHQLSGGMARKIGPDSSELNSEAQRNSRSTKKSNHAKGDNNNSNSNNNILTTLKGSKVKRTKSNDTTDSEATTPRSLTINLSTSDSGSRSRERSSRNRSREADEQQRANKENYPHHPSQEDERGRTSRMEDEVPRGRSPTMSIPNTLSSANSYNSRPSEFGTLRQYQAHVWRRTLLEESIMYSLKLGYAERNRSTSRHRSKSLKKNSLRAKKAREQAMLAAAMNKDLPPSPLPLSLDSITADDNDNKHAKEDEEVLVTVNSRGMTALRPPPPVQQSQQVKNSPYLMTNFSSTTNITHSFASFTLEVPEHQVSQIMATSVIPNLFQRKVTTAAPVLTSLKTSGNGTNGSPSPRVLRGVPGQV